MLAAVFCVCGYFVRQRQFTTLPLSFAVAAVGLWLTGPRGRAVRRNWSRADTVGAIVLAVGAAFLFNRVVLQHIQQWQVPTQYYKNRIVDLGLRAGLSLTIGLGVLPGHRRPRLAAAARPPRRPDLPRLRRLDRRRDRHALDLRRRQGRLPLD